MSTFVKKQRSYEVDMCSGPLFGKIIVFAIPLFLSGILQLLFNVADTVIVGRYAGSEAMAAVGSNGALINLMINMFMGLSVGANVLVARYFGSQDMKSLEEVIHTAMLVAIASGVALIFVGTAFAVPILKVMGAPDNILPLAVLYIRIYFVGMPALLVYNFGSAILRAVGDTKRPLYFLIFAGIINVSLNIFFVVKLSMGVAGVALATIISQFISAGLVVQCLMRTDTYYRLQIKHLRIVKSQFLDIAKIGLPAGLQGSLFSISNILIQSSINSFGSIAIAGSAAAANIEGFIYIGMNACAQTCLNFVSQNFGAKEWKRMKKSVGYCCGLVAVVGAGIGFSISIFGHQILSLYSTDAVVVEYGCERLAIIATTYFICGFMDVMGCAMRGMGYSITPMIISLTGICLLRIVWIFAVFPIYRSLETLYISYPISWIITLTIYLICYTFAWKKIGKNY